MIWDGFRQWGKRFYSNILLYYFKGISDYLVSNIIRTTSKLYSVKFSLNFSLPNWKKARHTTRVARRWAPKTFSRSQEWAYSRERARHGPLEDLLLRRSSVDVQTPKHRIKWLHARVSHRPNSSHPGRIGGTKIFQTLRALW